jgi:hypothetical protein
MVERCRSEEIKIAAQQLRDHHRNFASRLLCNKVHRSSRTQPRYPISPKQKRLGDMGAPLSAALPADL